MYYTHGMINKIGYYAIYYDQVVSSIDMRYNDPHWISGTLTFYHPIRYR